MPRFPAILIALLVLTLAVRVGVLLVMPGALVDDPDGYRRLAENVAAYGTLGEGTQPTAYRPPLYPLLLTPCVALGPGLARPAIGLLHVLLGLGTVGLVWRLGGRCGLGRSSAAAGVLVACDPILLGQSALVMTETAAAFFVALGLVALVRAVERPSVARSAAAGAVLALGGLCRPELLLWAALCVPAMFVVLGPGFSRRSDSLLKKLPSVLGARAIAQRWPGFHALGHRCAMSQAPGVVLQRAARVLFSASLVGAAILVLLPWAVRNQLQFGRPIVTTTHGGYTLLLANNPSFYEHLREGAWGTVWDARGLGPDWSGHARFESPAAELAADRRATAEAWKNIRGEPGTFAYACLARIGYFWQLAPHQGGRIARLAIGFWYFVEFALAAVGLWVALRVAHHGGTENTETTGGFWLWALLLAVSMTAVHTVYWSNMRMRGPLMPVVALAAAAGLVWWLGRRRSA